MTPAAVRQSLVDALRLDLIGPAPGSPHAGETLPQSPSRWYLTGFLVPLDAGETQRSDETADEGMEAAEASDTEDERPEPAAARRAFFPSSIGMSLLVPARASRLTATVSWGDYRQHVSATADSEEGEPIPAPEPLTLTAATPSPARLRRTWERTDHREQVTLELAAAAAGQPVEVAVPNSTGLVLVLAVRPIASEGISEKMVPKGTRSVSVFLVNKRKPAPDVSRDEGFAFQAELEVECDVPLVPRPNVRGLDTKDWDERVADLQYHNAFEYAVGHNVATSACPDSDAVCHRVATCWMPVAEVERVAPAAIEGVELGMEALAALADGQARAQLGALVALYRDWIDQQRTKVPATPKRRHDTADELLHRAAVAADRIQAGIDLLNDPQALEAFRLANKVMAVAARRRDAAKKEVAPADLPAPRWRPFQLAFVLMNLRGIACPDHADRGVVDLLFFPTGGGKTEAYLGLAAFTLVLRRLRHPGIASAGLSVLMRYTLRLLTLDQFGRAATLICALEQERQHAADRLGDWPFEIGLWVGRAATPNRMGEKGDGDTQSARARTIAFKDNDARMPSPIPLENCPWCGAKFKRNSFQLRPNQDHPTDLRVCCVNRDCDFGGGRELPIVAVDEPIYRRLPCFLIATVDKFAAMPWTGEVGGFFGRVERHDKGGFYGPCQPNVGRPLPVPSLPPPDLVIQDELHLISGPMGTMVGLYETALDELCARRDGERMVRPKIVASTATVRRAEQQIRALFNRPCADIFPPPGPDRRDSFFARTHTSRESNARQYLGIAAQGRSLKVVLLRTYLALLAAAQKAHDQAEKGRPRGKEARQQWLNPTDAYMTLLGYFNSLRELGGSRRIVEDEVSNRLAGYAARKRRGEAEGLFSRRKIAYEVVELTSRVSTDQVAEAKRRLALRFADKERVDVAIATNMISVGLDITRLGLMVVLGQPKTSAEYIQATSRVGREPDEGPGLVVALLNVHRPRDRSHYERFDAYHATFYRSVEATSVTPFSPRALDRGLAGAAVALARLGNPEMTPPKGATKVLQLRTQLDSVARAIAERAGGHARLSASEASSLRSRLLQRVGELFDDWSRIAKDYQDQGTELQYQEEVGAAKRLLYEFLHPDLKQVSPRHRRFRANRSMRDVEASVNLWVRTLDGVEAEVD